MPSRCERHDISWNKAGMVTDRPDNRPTHTLTPLVTAITEGVKETEYYHLYEQQH